MLDFCIDIFFSCRFCLTLSYTNDLHFSAAASEPINFNLLPNTSLSLSERWEVPARPNGIIVGYTTSCMTPVTLIDGPGAIH